MGKDFSKERFLRMRGSFFPRIDNYVTDIQVILAKTNPDPESIRKAILYSDALIRLYKMAYSNKVLTKEEFAYVSGLLQELYKELHLLKSYFVPGHYDSDLVDKTVETIIELKNEIKYVVVNGYTEKRKEAA